MSLLEFADFYQAYHSNEFGDFQKWLKKQNTLPKDTAYELEIVRIRNAFRLFKITQIIPLFFSCFIAIKNSEKKSSKEVKTFVKTMRFLEEYHLLNNKITSSIGNEVEKIYAKFSEDIFNTQNFSDDINRLRQMLEKKSATDEEVIAGFKNLNYKDANDRHLIRYIFDLVENHKVDFGASLPIFSYFDILSGNTPLYNIDHIFSQKEGKEVLDENVLHDIGNLIVIPRQMNSVFQTASYEERKDLILNWSDYDEKISNPPKFVSEFYAQDLPEESWNENAIKKNAGNLAKRLLSAIQNRYSY